MKLPHKKNVLFISPHPNDETISAGALLAELSKNNQVMCFFATVSPRGVDKDISDTKKIKLRKSEGVNACKELGIDCQFLNFDKSNLESPKNVIILKEIIKKQNPAAIITVHYQDAHPTHQKTANLVSKANRDLNVPIWFSEVWTPLQRPTDMFFFDNHLMQIKLTAISKYKTQLERTDWKKAMKALNQYRAITSTELLGTFGDNLKPQAIYAEAFIIT